jgi:hypothetical protein
MQLVRDLLDQVLRDQDGHPAGRADDFSIRIGDDGIYVESILSGGGVLADDLGILGRACDRLCCFVRRRPLRRASIPWSAVSEVAEHALTVRDALAGNDRVVRATGEIRLRAARRVPARSADGIRLHLLDLEVVDPRPRERLRVDGFIVRRRHRMAWPVSLRPRQRGASLDWRFVKAANVRLTSRELVVERTFDTLVPTRESPASRPPKHRPRSQS